MKDNKGNTGCKNCDNPCMSCFDSLKSLNPNMEIGTQCHIFKKLKDKREEAVKELESEMNTFKDGQKTLIDDLFQQAAMGDLYLTRNGATAVYLRRRSISCVMMHEMWYDGRLELYYENGWAYYGYQRRRGYDIIKRLDNKRFYENRIELANLAEKYAFNMMMEWYGKDYELTDGKKEHYDKGQVMRTIKAALEKAYKDGSRQAHKRKWTFRYPKWLARWVESITPTDYEDERHTDIFEDIKKGL